MKRVQSACICQTLHFQLKDGVSNSYNIKAVQEEVKLYTNFSQRFDGAYNEELQMWINATKKGYVDGPDAWDGYCCQVVAAAASKARDTQTIVDVVYDEMPDLYKK